MCLIGTLAVLFNFFSGKIGVLLSATDPSSFVPLFAPDFQVHLPWLNLWWALAFALCVAHLALHRWTATTRWVDLALSALGAWVLARIIMGGPISIYPAATILVKLALAGALLATVVALVKKLNDVLVGEQVVPQPERA
jgi:hypothetical protein